jgi:hypothetical protein
MPGTFRGTDGSNPVPSRAIRRGDNGGRLLDDGLPPGSYINFRGEDRERVEHFSTPLFGLTPRLEKAGTDG